MTIDRTTFDAPAEERPGSGPRAWVAVASGHAEPAVVDLPERTEIVIGRSRSSAIRVEDNAVSRTHATLRWDGGGTISLTDYGSRNGTLVDGRRVRGTSTIPSGSEVRVGDARLVVVIGGGSGEPGSLEALDDEDLLAFDPAMLRTVALADRAARSEGTVLLVGETGTGKELVAKRIHTRSPRAAGPFVPVNCGAVPEGTAEATFFGFEKGAFTGASEARGGLFEAADGGTLFLDEVGELSAASQARLLRVLEDARVRRVGATELVPVDVRVVCATHRDLDAMVANGSFRADLSYRLDVLRVEVPPLRERLEDVVPLALRFLRDLAPERDLKLTSDAVAALRAHGWPGNVRELRNAVERAVTLCRDEVVRATDLELSEAAGQASGAGLQRRVDDAERDAILEALRACGGNRTRAAERLGISRRALIYRLEKLGLKPPPPSERG